MRVLVAVVVCSVFLSGCLYQIGVLDSGLDVDEAAVRSDSFRLSYVFSGLLIVGSFHNVFFMADPCGMVNEEGVDRNVHTFELPAQIDGYDVSPRDIEIELLWDNPFTDDLDLFVYDEFGEVVGSSQDGNAGRQSAREHIEIEGSVASGAYDVHVCNCLGAAEYALKIAGVAVVDTSDD